MSESEIRPLLGNVNTPWVTDALFWTSDSLVSHYHFVLGGVLIAAVVLIPLIRSEQGRRTIDRWKLRAPATAARSR